MKKFAAAALVALFALPFCAGTAEAYKNFIVNGSTFSFPETDDVDWGDLVTDWAEAVTDGVIYQLGGDFPLTAELRFGATFGITLPYVADYATAASLSPPATTGFLRLQKGSSIAWRNHENSQNLYLIVGASNTLWFNGAQLSTDTAGALDAITSQLNLFIAAANSTMTKLSIATNTLRVDADRYNNFNSTGDKLTDDLLIWLSTTQADISGGSVGQKTFYFTSSSNTINSQQYLIMTTTPSVNIEHTISRTFKNTDGIVRFTSLTILSDSLPLNNKIPIGEWTSRYFMKVDNAGGITQRIIEISTMSKTGTNKWLLVSSTGADLNDLAPTQHSDTIIQSFEVVRSTDDLIVVELMWFTDSSVNRTVTWYEEGTTHASNLVTPIGLNATFIGLDDVPASYDLGAVGDSVRINATKTALEFYTPAAAIRVYKVLVGTLNSIPGTVDIASSTIDGFNEALRRINARGVIFSTGCGLIAYAPGVYEISNATVPGAAGNSPAPCVKWYAVDETSTVIVPVELGSRVATVYGEMRGFTIDYGSRTYNGQGVVVKGAGRVYATSVNSIEMSTAPGDTTSIFRVENATNAVLDVDMYSVRAKFFASGTRASGALSVFDSSNTVVTFRIHDVRLGAQSWGEAVFGGNTNVRCMNCTFDNAHGASLWIDSGNRYLGFENLNAVVTRLGNVNNGIVELTGASAGYSISSGTYFQDSVFINNSPDGIGFIFDVTNTSHQTWSTTFDGTKYFEMGNAGGNNPIIFKFVSTRDNVILNSNIRSRLPVTFISDGGTATSYTGNDNFMNSTEQ